jgi:hypothetical protein
MEERTQKERKKETKEGGRKKIAQVFTFLM